MKSLLTRGIFSVGIAFILAACAAPEPLPAEPYELTDGLGREISLPSSVERIVSLAPSNTEMLFALEPDLVLAMVARWPADVLGMAAVPAAALVGALLTVGLVYALARVGRSTPVTTLILAGVAVSSFATAITSTVMLLSASELHRAVTWMVGGFSLGGWDRKAMRTTGW